MRDWRGWGEERTQEKQEAQQAQENAGPCTCTWTQRREESGFDSKGSGELQKHFKDEGETTSLGSEKTFFFKNF